jgi:rod shape-determining protein MreD
MTVGDHSSDSFAVRLGMFFRSAIPGVMLLLLVLISILPLRLTAFAMVAPMLTLMGLYYWSVHRPDLVPMGLVFVIGLLQDAMMGAPMGIHAFVFMMCRWVIASQRRFLIGRPFLVLWWGFLVVAALTAVLEWSLYSIIIGRVLPVEPAVFRTLMTMGAFPALAWICIQCHRVVAH